MRILFIAIVIGTLGFIHADAAIEAANGETLSLCLDSMHLKDGSLVIRRSNQQGLALKIQIGKAAAEDCPPETTFKVPAETPCYLFNDELMLKLLPACNIRGVRNAWLVEGINRDGDIQVCVLQPFRHHPGTPDPTFHDFEIRSVKIYQDSSLRDIEAECGVKSDTQPNSNEDSK